MAVFLRTGNIVDNNGNAYASLMVWSSKDACQKLFPDATIVEYVGEAIENPTFIF